MRSFQIFIAVLAAALCLGSGAMAADLPPPEEFAVAQTGFAARYYAPPPGAPPQAAVVMLGGSDGGYPSRRAAIDLAEAGHPVLALAYFNGFVGKIDGLAARLERIPLEYVGGALDWLHRRLGPDRAIAIMGESRGAELALLVGSRRRDLAAIIAFSPTSVAWPAVGDLSGKVPAWTEGGAPVPYVDLPVADPARQFAAGLADRARARRAAIPVEQAHGVIMLVSSRSDGIWPAAAMADALVARLRASGFRPAVFNLQFDDASHLLMGPGPGVVRFTQGTFTVHFGGSEDGTLRARQVAWTAARQLLASLPTPASNAPGPATGGR